MEKRSSSSLHAPKPLIHHKSSLSMLKPLENLRLASAHSSRFKNTTQNTFKVDNEAITLYGKEEREQTITIQNIGRNPSKLNITVPKTIYFHIQEEHRNFTLSAGMSKKIPITLIEIPPDNTCIDFVLIQT